MVVRGGLVKTAKLRDEYYVLMEDPEDFAARLRSSKAKADLFTFVQEIHDRTPKYQFHCEPDDLAVLHITTYEKWWKSLKDKTRNMVRKAQKSGVEVRVAEFNDELVRGIQEIYNETRIRQGKRNAHYGKDFETVKREHVTFVERSEFIGAFYEGRLIGFVKVTHSKNYSMLMNIVAMISHRDKAPTNALIAKTVEACSSRNIPYLNYGTWGKRPGLNEFKLANKFESFEVPRYFIPLTQKGKFALKFNLHQGMAYYVPEKWIEVAAAWRAKWNAFKYGNQLPLRGSSSIGRASR